MQGSSESQPGGGGYFSSGVKFHDFFRMDELVWMYKVLRTFASGDERVASQSLDGDPITELDLMDLIGEDRKWMVGRKLMQMNDTLTSEDAGLRSSKNCTEPDKAKLLEFATRRTNKYADLVL
ncbi:sodium/potassium/calcium exchanger 3 [Cricetulus griseus]|nr:sodium/potassium/calcium exchanger 3 [Cricetulus griseus]